MAWHINNTVTNRVVLNHINLHKKASASVLIDGILQALIVKSPQIFATDIRSGSDVYPTDPNGYRPGTATTPPVGFRFSALSFPTTYIGGETNSTCHIEMEGTGNFGGYKVQTTIDRIFNSAVSTSQPTTYLAFSWTTAAMNGTGVYFTPNNNGSKIVVILTGKGWCSSVGTIFYMLRYGTGTKPNHGDAVVGTAIGGEIEIASAVAFAECPITRALVISGLTAGVRYWVDLSAYVGVSGSTGYLNVVDTTTLEL
jgi:hypothetical protein